MVNQADLSKLKQDLETRQQELSDKIKADKLRESEEEYSTELSDYDNHPGDSGTELYEREKDIALKSHEMTELDSINHALERIQKDEYGTCDVCGTEIDIERLKARPETNVCYEHAESQTQLEEEKDYSMSSLEIDDTDSWNTLADYGSSQTPIDRNTNTENYQEPTEESDEENPDQMDRFSNKDKLND